LEAVNLGKKIGTKRSELKFTARELAKQAGITPSLLSQIERGLVTPSIKTLRMIAHALDVPIFTLFLNDNKADALVVRKNSRKVISNPLMEQVSYELLSPDLRGNLEFALMKLPPKTSSSEHLLAHKGEEAAYVLKGEIILCLEKEHVELTVGDSVRITPYLKHKWLNLNEIEAELIFGVTPPSF
jgi:transcriptional regulator with XRE-family HTH domain